MAINIKQPGDTITAADINDLQDQISSLSAGGANPAFFLSGNMYVATGIQYRLMAKAGTIERVYAHIITAPAGADLQIDINLNGVTIFSSPFAIADGANSANSAALAVTTITAGDYFSLDIDQIGSGTAGADLMVTIKLT